MNEIAKPPFAVAGPSGHNSPKVAIDRSAELETFAKIHPRNLLIPRSHALPIHLLRSARARTSSGVCGVAQARGVCAQRPPTLIFALHRRHVVAQIRGRVLCGLSQGLLYQSFDILALLD